MGVGDIFTLTVHLPTYTMDVVATTTTATATVATAVGAVGAVRVVLLIPYRVHVKQNREHHLSKLLDTMPSVLNEALGAGTWAIYIAEQSSDGKFARGRCLNAVARIVKVRYPGANLVLHDVDLLPDVERAKLYGHSPPRRGILALHSDCGEYGTKRKKRGETKVGNNTHVGGICCVTQDTFWDVNGFQNTFKGWGGEETCFRNAVLSLYRRDVHRDAGPCIVSSTAGIVTDLEALDLQEEPVDGRRRYVRANEVDDMNSPRDVRSACMAEAERTNYANGARQLVFEVTRTRLFPGIDDNITMVTLNLYVQLPPAWSMAISKTHNLPYYFKLLGGEPTFVFPGTSVLHRSPSLPLPSTSTEGADKTPE